MQSNLHLGPTLHNGLFFVRGGQSMPRVLFRPLYNGHTATFFCHQGGRCEEVQLQNKERIRFSFKKSLRT